MRTDPALLPRCGKTDCAICQERTARADRAEAERRDTERIASELRDQLDANPALADAVIRNLLLNPAADVIDAIAEAISEEDS